MSDAIRCPEPRAKAAEQLADRVLALWNEPEADRRMSASQILGPPQAMREIAAARGHGGLQARAMTSDEHRAGSGGLSFRARDDARKLGEVDRDPWEAVAGGGSTAAAGLNVLVLAAAGRGRRNHTFVEGA